LGYYQTVYQLVAQIPRGKVATYGQLALMAGSPRGARAVGYAVRACRCPQIPCHRVLRADGSTAPAFGPGIQQALLEAEGVEFDGQGRADLSRFRWDGR
jgi:methylated-DNA-protein-cysteine methyltransferase-like protein